MTTQGFLLARCGVWLAFCSAMFCIAIPVVSAQTETVIHSFADNGTDGFQPYGGLAADKSGNLYGTTYDGGHTGVGMVYKLIPPTANGAAWSESILYAFGPGTDARNPYGPLLLDEKSNKIYGTTYAGGNKDLGTVFELTPPADSGGAWTEVVLHSFSGSDGQYPFSGVISDGQGNLYGTASGGGINNGGTVFRLSPPASGGGSWEETILLYFNGPAETPVDGLAFDRKGALYGSSTNVNGGAIYELTPPKTGDTWAESIIYSFPGGSDGSVPTTGPVFGPEGVLYGTALDSDSLACDIGCGLVYRLAPSSTAGGAWRESVLHRFTGRRDGGIPVTPVILDSAGRVYGTTEYGGDYYCDPNPPQGCGVAFRLSPPALPGGAWSDEVLHTFRGGSDGYFPHTPLLL